MTYYLIPNHSLPSILFYQRKKVIESGHADIPSKFIVISLKVSIMDIFQMEVVVGIELPLPVTLLV
jgi:hypothetical protein